MVVLVDNNKAMEISIREWDEGNTQYGPDWAADFFDVGSLPRIPNLSDYTDADLAELGLPKRTVIQLDDVVEPSGRFSIKSIFAGGYNIQCPHVRVLVHKLK